MTRRVILIAATLATMVGMVAGEAHAQAAVPPGERFVLSGVVYVEGGRGVAWLQEPTFTNNRIVTVRLGDSIGPYRVTKILEGQVELEGPGGKVAVPLAGGGGAISVAASPEILRSPAHELPPHPALNNPEAIVIPRGDPRRNFPASSLLIGAGAPLLGEAGSQTSHPAVATPPAVARALDRGVIPPPIQTPELAPHPALNNPNAIVIPRGDPRRNFPASSLLVGAGAPLLGRP